MSLLESIIANGNRGHQGFSDSHIECADGFTLSVIAGGGTYCLPRPVFCNCSFNDMFEFHAPLPGETKHDYPGPYKAVEVGYPSQKPEPWGEWSKYVEDPDRPVETVYGYVPVDLVRALVASHGGEVS